MKQKNSSEVHIYTKISYIYKYKSFIEKFKKLN